MTPALQISLFKLLTGEPSSGGRWEDPDIIQFINLGRSELAEKTRCFQIRDSQTTSSGTKSYSLQNDVIDFYALEYDGHPLTPVRPEDWRATIGDDDTIKGDPSVYKYQARQIQLFEVPNAAKTLRYEGWGYPTALTATGSDTEFTDRMAEGGVALGVIIAKMADERALGREEKIAADIIAELSRQFRQKGPRRVRFGHTTSAIPRWLRNG